MHRQFQKDLSKLSSKDDISLVHNKMGLMATTEMIKEIRVKTIPVVAEFKAQLEQYSQDHVDMRLCVQ